MPDDLRSPRFTAWDLLALAAFAGLWVAYRTQLPSLPDPVPTHFDARGLANGWTPKAALPYVIFGLPIGLWVILAGSAWLGARTQSDPARARAMTMAPMRGLMGLGLAWLMGALLYVPSLGGSALLAGLLGFGVCLLVGLVFMVRDFAALPRLHDDDRFYKWKIFYYNPDDRRLLVEKRLGIGYTFNFARPASWLIMALVLAPLLLLAFR